MYKKDYRMSHTYGWIVEKDSALELIHEMLTTILQNQPKQYMSLQGLISQLNRVGRQYHIHTQKKHNCWSKYIKMTYGDIQEFLQEFRFYNVVKRDDKTYVYFVDELYESSEKMPRFTKDKDWIFVDEYDM